MQLLRMELKGFKSFADKTVLTFDKGITAIVGPNGSGKSNISDAIRWVMGEQNIRQLRGQRAEDIIFSGTEKRRPQGVAEVSLFFDNRDHQLDIEYDEVAITRRIFRSGESEFYINKKPCRLKDIHFLFADTGIGQDSMAVIGQNRVDRILNSKPEERRIIFEEVVGISRYKTRKQEGLRKIAETDRNLERIHDMMSVLEEQLTPMKEQADKLRQFRGLDSERISYEGTLALQELRNAERLLSKVEHVRLSALVEQQTASKSLEDKAAQRHAVMAAMEAENARLQEIDDAALKAHRELDSLKSRYDAFASRQRELNDSLMQLEQETNVMAEKQARAVQQKQELNQQLERRQRELEATTQGFQLTQDLYGQAEEKAKAAADALEQVHSRNAEKEQRIFILHRDIDDLQRRLDENRTHATELEEEQAKQSVTLDKLKKEYEHVTQELDGLRRAADAASTANEAAVAHKETAEKSLVQIEREYRRLRGQAAAQEQRIRVLEGMEQDHEGVGRAVKTVLGAATSWRAGIEGIVGELCIIPSAYATAIDIALGGASQYVVTDNEGTAKAAIAYLKERRAGRTTFLPVETVRERNRTRDEEMAANETGILGFASDLISYEPRYGRIFSSLLGKTLLAESMDTASLVARKYHHRLRIVCLDGTQFNAGGSLTGGSHKSKEGSFISRRAALMDLREEAKKTQSQIEALTERGKVLRSEADTAALEAAVQLDAMHEAKLSLEKAQWRAEDCQKEMKRLTDSTSSSTNRLDEVLDERTKIQQALAQKTEDLDGLMETQSEDTALLEDKRQKAQIALEQCRRELTERQVALATLTEQIHHVQEQIEQSRELAEQTDADAARLKERHEGMTARLTETKTLLADLTVHIGQKETEATQKDEEKNVFYEKRDTHFKQSQKLEEELASLREELQQWNEKVHSADVQLEKYKGEISRGEERLARQGLTRQEAMERRRDGSLKELNAKVAALHEAIAALGQINPNADVEYQNAVDKQEFYHTQCDDLLESKKRLETVVAEIDEAMSTQFAKGFSEIGIHFQRIFSQLFGGGTAHLSLTDTKDVLQAGVTILIQPPGKKQQPLTLLSGGERALTVIALLLAFLAYHPAPFVLFDEVDAALDEANVIRMARYMKNYSGTTQFIVITHRRKTMEAAHTLQGVTMEEKGVSRLLTVKVDEVLQKGT
jgi:chromosome segregation protein